MRVTPSSSSEAASRKFEPLFPLPLVGRDAELATLAARLDAARSGTGGTTLIAGAGGIGKSRLVAAMCDRAERQLWTTSIGRANPVETGVPYAIFADALAPLVRSLTPASLAVLTRGDAASLASICPAFSPGGAPVRAGDASDAKARLFWTFTQFLAQLATQRPVLLVLENLHWADASSLELLHFVARQIPTHRIALLCTYNDEARDTSSAFRMTEQSLLAVGTATLIRIQPLDDTALHTLVREMFRADDASARTLSARVYAWTRGNAFFVEEILKALVSSGALHQHGGVWHGWEAAPPDLPRSIRAALAARMDRLGAPARGLANMASVIGTRTSHDVLGRVSGMSEDDVLVALDELRANGILSESVQPGGEIRYAFTHPLMRDVLYAELGIARCRLLHASIAQSLESLHGGSADAHADELAYHYARAESRALAAKAVRYLVLAGRGAIARYANQEAADYLGAALQHCDRADPATQLDIDSVDLVEQLARVRQRLGDYGGATELWTRARQSAERTHDTVRVATIDRRMGLASYWSGRYPEALAHFDAALDALAVSSDASLVARVRVGRAMTLQALGDPLAARSDVEAALALAERLDDAGVLARVHRASLVLHIFTGPAERAYADGARAIAFAEKAGERGVEWSAHWAMAMVGGLSGNGAMMSRHLGEGDRLADALGSPVLRCWMAEIAIEYASGTGEWDAGLALAERTIPLARALGQRMLLPRLLVWAAMIHLHRGNSGLAKDYLDEALGLTRDAARTLLDVHSSVPVHAGLVAYHVAAGEHRLAIEVGERGLALVDSTGYVAWSVHRLLPGMIEAALWLRDLETAERYRDRLRRDSLQLGHQLGLAWADTCDALMRMLRDDLAGAIPLLRRGADALDAVPWVLDAARARRNLGWVLGKSGDRDGAARELRRAHDVFVQLGAEPELTRTREVIRELGLRPPARTQNVGAGGLTGREVDVARLAATHKSNKEIASALGISPRPVSTHLSSIFEKLDVGSRGQLADVARREGLTDQ
ncbi:MAG: AAA family ATPase [Gemmatimonadaceae bacterium]|nr:AAA family ATPase [Gemmatimonadaceae bacterium]